MEEQTPFLRMWSRYWQKRGWSSGVDSGSFYLNSASKKPSHLTDAIKPEEKKKKNKYRDDKNSVTASGVGRKFPAVFTDSVEEFNSDLVGVHCTAHHLAIAASDAAKSVENVKRFRRIWGKFVFFSNSAVRSNKLDELQTQYRNS